jgi:hypothetical protein
VRFLFNSISLLGVESKHVKDQELLGLTKEHLHREFQSFDSCEKFEEENSRGDGIEHQEKAECSNEVLERQLLRSHLVFVDFPKNLVHVAFLDVLDDSSR